jgi:hypothetical protein
MGYKLGCKVMNFFLEKQKKIGKRMNGARRRKQSKNKLEKCFVIYEAV